MTFMDWHDRITSDPGICGGKPCIRGMRLRVRDVLELLSAGASVQQVLDDYPYVDREDIQACLDFAADRADHPFVSLAAE